MLWEFLQASTGLNIGSCGVHKASNNLNFHGSSQKLEGETEEMEAGKARI